MQRANTFTAAAAKRRITAAVIPSAANAAIANKETFASLSSSAFAPSRLFSPVRDFFSVSSFMPSGAIIPFGSPFKDIFTFIASSAPAFISSSAVVVRAPSPPGIMPCPYFRYIKFLIYNVFSRCVPVKRRRCKEYARKGKKYFKINK